MNSKPVIGINGLGRMGFGAVRDARRLGFPIGAINASRTAKEMAYIIKYDSVHGKYSGDVSVIDDHHIAIDGQKIAIFDERDPAKIPWADASVEYVIECTGKFLKTEDASKHLNGGAKKVIISAPAKDDTPMFVYGVNHQNYTSDMKVISNASCTTNCLSPIVKILFENFGIEYAFMNTIHAETSKQEIVDGFNRKDWRIGRDGGRNIIPTTTGAAEAVGKIIPEVNGIITGISERVPVQDGSLVSLCAKLKRDATKQDICNAVKFAIQNGMSEVIEYCEDEIVSSDIIDNFHPCVFDSKFINIVTPTFVNVLAWYDNEMSYIAQMFRMLMYMWKVDNCCI